LVSFIVPVYNKADSLEEDITALYDFLTSRLGSGCEIVLSDDGSTDASPEIGRRLEKTLPRLRALGYPENRGRGYAVKFAGKACAGDCIIYLDLDFPRTTGLEKLLEMKARLERSPVVIGSRFLPDSQTQRIRLRNVVGKSYRSIVRLCLPGLRVSDPDVGFKGFDRGFFLSMAEVSRQDRWSWDLEALVIARRNGLAIEEFPIDWDERHAGYSTSVSLFRDAFSEFKGLLEIRRAMKKGLYDL
jgi:glycosyltransferase involved in cell wall biosynthesis